MKQKLLIISLAALLTVPTTAQVRKPTPNDTPVTMMEKLDRGLVVIPVDEASATAKHYFASWRYLGTDDTHTTFTILKNGKPFSKATTAMTDATWRRSPARPQTAGRLSPFMTATAQT